MRHVLVIWLLIFANSYFTVSHAQQMLFRHYSVAEGLPSSTVRAVVQDHQGFVWLGTKNGLSRFDGYTFKNYQYKKGVAGALGNNFIHCLLLVDSTHIWVGTEDGVYILDVATEQFLRWDKMPVDVVFDMDTDADNHIWIATRSSGLIRYNTGNNHIDFFTTKGKEKTVSSNHINKVLCDKNGWVWIATNGSGVDCYNAANGAWKNFSAANSQLPDNAVIALGQSAKGAVWLGTMGSGVLQMDTLGVVLQAYKKDGSINGLQDGIVRAVHAHNGRVFFGTEKGIHVLDEATHTIKAYTNAGYDSYSLSDNAVYAIYPDKAGRVWVGTWFGGANYFMAGGSPFEVYYPTGQPDKLAGRAVSCFLEYRPAQWWIGTEDGGLHYFDADTKKFRQYPFQPQQQPLSYHNIHALQTDREGNIWIGLFNSGVNILDPGSGKVAVKQHEPGNAYSLNDNLVFTLFEDSKGTMYVGTSTGLNAYNKAKDNFTRISNPLAAQMFVYKIVEDANGVLWMATYDRGLFAWNRKTNSWQNINSNSKPSALPSDKLICLHADGRGNLWLGSDGGGLSRYDLRSGDVKSYGDAEGLFSNIIFGIVEDDDGLLWLTTNNGLYHLDPKTDRLRHYSKQDNLQGQQFNYNALYKGSDGKIFAGGIRGFNSFYPQGTTVSAPTAAMVFTNFQLFNANTFVGDSYGVLQRQIQFTEHLQLRHDQNVFSIEFAAINTRTPEKVRYAYKMDGFDAQWNYVADQRKATYTNLWPGTYTFRVKASTDESSWDVPEKTMQVTIAPPWYQTGWAYLLYAVLFLSAAYGAYYYTAAYMRRKNQIRLERLKNKEASEFYARKIEFFTVMAHEIRTPLSLIIAPLEKLLHKNTVQDTDRAQLAVMEENADRLMNLVNQLLDFRRIESDAYEIKKEPVDIVSVVQSVYSRFSALPLQRDIAFTMSTAISSLTMDADPEVLDKILSNLLMNAFKFSRKQVNMAIEDGHTTGEDGKIVRISVQDDGIGIPASDLKNIFRRFFTASHGEHQYHNLGSTGIGLSLASALAEKHGGSLQVSSEQGVYTRFVLALPYEDYVPRSKKPALVPDHQIVSGKPLVLLAEDDLAILNFLQSSFLQSGYSTICAANGSDAFALLQQHDVDIVVSDVMMPVMDGIDLCKKIKSEIEYSHVPVILLTAKSNTDARIEGLEAGADGYVAKPFKWKHLSALVVNQLEAKARLRKKFADNPLSTATVLTTNARDEAFMQQLVQVITNRITDPQLSVEELSKAMAMSRSSLHKKLKAMSGYVPNELIRLVKLKHAAMLLQRREYTMTEVAYMAGFSSPSYFGKCFHQQFKLTPTEYAEQQHMIPIDPETFFS